MVRSGPPIRKVVVRPRRPLEGPDKVLFVARELEKSPQSAGSPPPSEPGQYGIHRPAVGASNPRMLSVGESL
eukprot:8986182-Lingulodinium_polyedra.AAC.1